MGTFNSILYNAYATANIKLNIMRRHTLISSDALRSWDRRDNGTKLHEEATTILGPPCATSASDGTTFTPYDTGTAGA